MNAIFTTARELNRKGSTILDALEKMKGVFIVTKKGKPKCFMAPYEEYSDFKRYQEWKRLQQMSSEEIIEEIQSLPLSQKNIPSLEEQLSDL